MTPAEHYAVDVLDEVKTIDMPALLEIEPAAGKAVAEVVAKLHTDPWLGQEMRARMRLEILEHRRKVPFDLPGWDDRPRFRLVYRSDPSDGSIAVVTVLWVGPRSELKAYRQAAARAGGEERRRRRDERL